MDSDILENEHADASEYVDDEMNSHEEIGNCSILSFTQNDIITMHGNL